MGDAGKMLRNLMKLYKHTFSENPTSFDRKLNFPHRKSRSNSNVDRKNIEINGFDISLIAKNSKINK